MHSPAALEALKKYFGYDGFKEGQENVIGQIMSGRDVLGIMPTGAGKSICYQIPAVILPGVTVVISPLISLMKDQVDALNQTGISSTYINSSLEQKEVTARMFKARAGGYKLLYIAPERLESGEFTQFIQKIPVSMVAVDEAHCVSQWGHDFRPSYTAIAAIIQALPQRPVVSAFTATATDRVKRDIVALLKLKNPFQIVTGFDRPNLYFGVEKGIDKNKAIITYINDRRRESGIIYCMTRKETEGVYNRLVKVGIKAACYHAGLPEPVRTKSQEDFIYDRVSVIVATNAFGMGINKSNVRYVLHYNMPRSMESYYQEAGRAGRDGEPAECLLFYSPADIVMNKYLIAQTKAEGSRDEEYAKLRRMVNYCNTDGCLRKEILEYFGETAPSRCGGCSNCDSDLETTDITVESQKIMSCVKRMGERFGVVMVAQVLKGSRIAKIRELKFDGLSTYGIMAEYSLEAIKEIISYLISKDYLNQDEGEYSVIHLSARSLPVLQGKERVSIHRHIPKAQPARKDIQEYDRKLFDILRQQRNAIASAQGVPPYIIFSDLSLREMCIFYPTDEVSFRNIHGVGDVKNTHYGSVFIEAISQYVKEKNIHLDALDKPRAKPKPKEDTRMTTYGLYKQGMSIEAIAGLRSLNPMTVENHLVECMLKGLAVEGIVQEEYAGQVEEAIAKVGIQKLKSIKELLPSQVRYSTVKYYVGAYKQRLE